jgi:hypothetical protein
MNLIYDYQVTSTQSLKLYLDYKAIKVLQNQTVKLKRISV